MSNISITDEGIEIDNVLIKEKTFSEELINFCVRDREQQIDDLYMWIGEAIRDRRENDLYAMKEDLRYLESLDDEFVFSDISTNNFIAKSDNEKQFNEICASILKLNGEENEI